MMESDFVNYTNGTTNLNQGGGVANIGNGCNAD